MFHFCALRNGIAAKEVERQLGVTYKTAWCLCHRIRDCMGLVDGDGPLGGPGKQVEIAKTFIGGFPAPKTVVLCMVERGGDVMTHVVPDQRRATLTPLINVEFIPGGAIHTDELRSYLGRNKRGHRHMTVNHSAKEYVGLDSASSNAI